MAILLLLLGLGGYLALRQYLPPALSQWVAGPGFHQMLSRSVSTALKVDGTFGSLTLGPNLSVKAENFHSQGWPGQAIGGLDTGEAIGWFNPWAIFRKKWEVDLITIKTANFRLINPDNALKAKDPVSPPKPWYAFIMPSQFFCKWIDCPDMSIELPLGQTKIVGSNLHVGSMMIGRNFKYFGRNGIFHYPGYADMAIDALEVYVTREVIEIGYLYLREEGSPHSNVDLTARLGQRADKSIKSQAQLTSLNIVPFLPQALATILSGRLNGELNYATDTSGGNATGSGSLSLEGTTLANWEYLNRLADRANDLRFKKLDFPQVSLDYTLADGLFQMENLVISGEKEIDLKGEGSWNIESGAATASLRIDRVPLGAYLPKSITGHAQGDLRGQVSWSWEGAQLSEGLGGGSLELSQTQLEGFTFQTFLGRFLKTDDYAKLSITEAACTWKQDATGFHMENLNVLAPGQAGLRGHAHVAPDGTLHGFVRAGFPAAALTWLPAATSTVFAHAEDGLHWCTIELSGTMKEPKNNLTPQLLHQLEKHPIAMAELAMRGLSWWLGDLLGNGEKE